MLDYRIVERAPFTIVGMKRSFDSDTSYQEIPKYWNEWAADRKGICGMFGVCMDMDGKIFDYWIADLYEPWKDIPDGAETAQIPGSQHQLHLHTFEEDLIDESIKKASHSWDTFLQKLI